MLATLRGLPDGLCIPAPTAALADLARVDLLARIRSNQSSPEPISLRQDSKVRILVPLHGTVLLHQTDGTEAICPPGSIMVLPMPMAAEYRNQVDEDGHFDNCWMILSGSTCIDLARRVSQQSSVWDMELRPQAMRHLIDCFMHGLGANGADPIGLAASANACLMYLIAAEQSSGGLGRVLALIARDLEDPDLDVASLAQYADCAASTFNRRFRSAVGMTPYRYILQRRIDRARELLCGSDTVTQIAQQCGFRDVSHFVQSFRSMVGESPGRYRKRLNERH